MPLPVIANTWACTYVWGNVNAPNPATFTIHYLDISGTQTAANLAADIETSTTQDMWRQMTSAAIASKLNIIKLDGVSAGQSFATSGGAKWTGSGGADTILQGAIVVSLKSAQRGPRGRNRIFLPWAAESEQTNGTLLAPGQALMQAAWNVYQPAMVALGWRTVAVSAKYADQHEVANIVVRNFLKTQRRRAR